MRVFTATLGTETDSWSPIPTGWDSFRDVMLWRPGEHPDFVTEATGPLWACRQRSAKSEFEVIEGTCAFAMPGGPTARTVYEDLRNEILDQLRAAMPVDLVALGLHGAMMAHGYPDCEGDLLARVRQIVGPSVTVGAELDLHCHLSESMVESADVLVTFKEYPHTDYLERAHELIALMVRAREDVVKPVMSVFDCRMIAGFSTVEPPMRDFVDDIRSLEGRDGVLSISLIHGFSKGDTPDLGSKVLVITDDDRKFGDALARKLGRRFFDLRESSLSSDSLPMEKALQEALEAEGFPVILAEASDNPCGGSAGDSTVLLRAMRRLGVQPACIGPFWDPIAVDLCFSAGEGAEIDLRIGGKIGPMSGDPMDVRARVIGLADEILQNLGEGRMSLGRCAAIEFDGIAVALCSKRDQAYSPNLFTDVGIDPSSRRFIVVKSTQQFRMGFGSLGKRVIVVDASLAKTERMFTKITRPRWPFDDDPFAGAPS